MREILFRDMRLDNGERREKNMPGGRCGLFPSLEKQREEAKRQWVAERDLLSLAIKTWGEDDEIKMVLEEMSELQKEICKRWRGKDNAAAIAEEIADVEITLEILKMILHAEKDVEQIRAQKLKRLAERLGVARETVSAWRRKQGLPNNSDRGRPDGAGRKSGTSVLDTPETRELYDQGLSDAKIGEKMHINAISVLRWRQKNGLPPNHPKGGRKC